MFSAAMPAEAGTRPQLPWVWGEPVAVDPALDRPAGQMRTVTRSVTSAAAPEALFSWLCHLRRAPYSYDWIDNFGRRSPRVADPRLCALEVGQTFMTIFTLTDAVPGRSVTLRMKPGWPSRVFGPIVLQYEARARAGGHSLLSAVMWMPPIGSIAPRVRRYLLAWGDLIMMRRQLRLLVTLAERDERANEQRGTPRAEC